MKPDPPARAAGRRRSRLQHSQFLRDRRGALVSASKRDRHDGRRRLEDLVVITGLIEVQHGAHLVGAHAVPSPSFSSTSHQQLCVGALFLAR